MPKEVEKMPIAAVRVTRSVRKRLESVDSDVSGRSDTPSISGRSNTPNICDLESITEEMSPTSSEKNNSTLNTPAKNIKSKMQGLESNLTETTNSPARRRGRRASSVGLNENINKENEDIKTPGKQTPIAGRRLTRRSSALIEEEELTPVVASPSRRTRRRSINLIENVTESNVQDSKVIVKRRINLLDTCVPEEELTESSSKCAQSEPMNKCKEEESTKFLSKCAEPEAKLVTTNNNSSVYNSKNEINNTLSLSPAHCTRSRSKSPREINKEKDVENHLQNELIETPQIDQEKGNLEVMEKKLEENMSTNQISAENSENLNDKFIYVTLRNTSGKLKNKSFEKENSPKFEDNGKQVKSFIDPKTVIEKLRNDNVLDNKRKDGCNISNIMQTDESNIKTFVDKNTLNYSLNSRSKILNPSIKENSFLSSKYLDDINIEIEKQNFEISNRIENRISESKGNVEKKFITLEEQQQSENEGQTSAESTKFDQQLLELEKSLGVKDDEIQDEENLTPNVASKNLMSHCNTENSMTPFKKRMSCELTASSTPILIAGEISNENTFNVLSKSEMLSTQKGKQEEKDQTSKIYQKVHQSDCSLKNNTSSKKCQSVTILPSDSDNDKSSKFPKTPIPSKTRSRINDFDSSISLEEENEDSFEKLNTTTDTNTNIKMILTPNEKIGMLTLSDNECEKENKSSKEEQTTQDEFAKSWSQSVKGTADTSIDSYGLVQNRTNEDEDVANIVRKNKNGSENTSEIVKRSDKFSVTEKTEDEDEEDENMNEENDKSIKEICEFVDDEAEEVDYNSNDSMDTEEKIYLEQNEIPDEGVSIGSQDTIEENRNDNENGSSDEMDSFIVSDDDDCDENDTYEFESDREVEEYVSKKKVMLGKKKKMIKKLSSDDEEEKENEQERSIKRSDNNDNSNRKSENLIKITESKKEETLNKEINKHINKDVNQCSNIDIIENLITNSIKEDEKNHDKENEKEQLTTLEEIEDQYKDNDKKLKDISALKGERDLLNANNSNETNENRNEKERNITKVQKRYSLPIMDKSINLSREKREIISLEREIIIAPSITNVNEEKKNSQVKKVNDLETVISKNNDDQIENSNDNLRNQIEENSLNLTNKNITKLNKSCNTKKLVSDNINYSSLHLSKIFEEKRFSSSDDERSIDNDNENDDFDNFENNETNKIEIRSEINEKNENSSFMKKSLKISVSVKDNDNGKKLDDSDDHYEKILKKCEEMMEKVAETKKKEKMLNKKMKPKKNKQKKKQNDEDSIDISKEINENKEKAIKKAFAVSEKILQGQFKFRKEDLQKKHSKKKEPKLKLERLSEEIINNIETSPSTNKEKISQKITKTSKIKKAQKSGISPILVRETQKRKLSEESEVEISENNNNNPIKKKISGVIKKPSGLIFEESITPLKSKKDEIKILKFPWGTVREKPIISKISNGFEETFMTPKFTRYFSDSNNEKKKNDKKHVDKNIIQYPWGTTREEIIKQTKTQTTTKSLSHKIRKAISAGQIEPPVLDKTTGKKSKTNREILEPVTVLSKPKWIKCGEKRQFTLKEAHKTKRLRLNEPSTSSGTEFFVESNKERKQLQSGTVSTTALEFKRKNLLSKNILRETSKQLIQKKDKLYFHQKF